MQSFGMGFLCPGGGYAAGAEGYCGGLQEKAFRENRRNHRQRGQDQHQGVHGGSALRKISCAEDRGKFQ